MTGLLIVGGLTIDRFDDGTTAPGGSILHAGLAAAAAGVRPVFLTVAGDEPEARRGLAQLAELGELHAERVAATTLFGHGEADGRRVLFYETAGGTIDVPPAGLPEVGLVLAAPIAAELPPAVVARLRETLRPRLVTLLIQGWLRRLVPGEPVRALGLDDIDGETWDCFAAADVIVVSTEDLAEVPHDPFAQAAALRARFGSRPLLVLTLGTEGYLLDDPRADRVVATVPRRVVTGVSTVGAGDTFGAALTLHLASGATPPDAAEAATDRVIDLLESRRT